MKTMEIDKNTRIIDLTVGQLIEIIGQKPSTPEPAKERHLEYGLAGIAKIYNCSIRTAARIKASGVIDEAIEQRCRTIIIDVDKALTLLSK